MKKIFVITGSPKGEDSLALPFVKKYIETAKNVGNEVKMVDSYKLEFDFLQYKDGKFDNSLTPELKEVQDNILWADQIVFVYPLWEGSLPAKLKALLERVLQLGIFFEYSKTGPKGLIKNKTAVIIQSYSAPAFFIKYLKGDAGYRTLKDNSLDYCGIRTEKRFDFDLIDTMDEKTKQKRLKEIEIFASKIG